MTNMTKQLSLPAEHVMTLDELRIAINAACEPAEGRMHAAHDDARKFHPAVSDWMTDAELAELHRLQMLYATHPDNTAEAARARAKAKRAARKNKGYRKNDEP